MGVDRRRYDCFLYVTGGVREIVYFFVPLQETSLLMHVSVALEEAKAWIYLILFCVDIGEIYFFLFSVEGDEGRSVYASTSCFEKNNLQGLYGLQKRLSIGRTVHFNAVPSGGNV